MSPSPSLHVTSSTAAWVTSVLVVALLVLLAVRAFRHRARLRTIPVRIHVAGVRGKSTIVRLIAAGLRTNGNLHVLAKTTGVEPRWIDEAGRERPWRRIGAPSVHEQRRFIRMAAKRGSTHVVIESMAVQPEYLWASEHLLLHATHTVVSNVRVDHQEAYGDDLSNVAAALAEVVPVHGRLWMVGSVHRALSDRAAAVGCETHTVPRESSFELTNRAMALAVCECLGVGRETAARGMSMLEPDETEFRVLACRRGDRIVRFANAFACNDVASLDVLMRQTQPRGTNRADVVLVASRVDRPLRTRAFLRYVGDTHPNVQVYVHMFGPNPRLGFSLQGAVTLRSHDPAEIWTQLVSAAGPGGHVWGVGNWAGIGGDLVRYLDREAAC